MHEIALKNGLNFKKQQNMDFAETKVYPSLKRTWHVELEGSPFQKGN